MMNKSEEELIEKIAKYIFDGEIARDDYCWKVAGSPEKNRMRRKAKHIIKIVKEW